MISEERREELEFLVRIGAHVKLRESADVRTPDLADKGDYYTLRELVDVNIFRFVELTEGDLIIEVNYDMKLAKANTMFDFEELHQGRQFKMTTNERLYADFIDLI